MTNNRFTPPRPSMHRHIPLGTLVITPERYTPGGQNGEIVGISSLGVIWTYIVLLDEPYQDPEFGLTRAIAVPGTELRTR